MKSLGVLVVVMLCAASMLLLSGCKGTGSSASGGGSSGFSVASLDVPDDPDGPVGPIPHNPEPATLALLGTGLVGYALIRRWKNKK